MQRNPKGTEVGSREERNVVVNVKKNANAWGQTVENGNPTYNKSTNAKKNLFFSTQQRNNNNNNNNNVKWKTTTNEQQRNNNKQRNNVNRKRGPTGRIERTNEQR